MPAQARTDLIIQKTSSRISSYLAFLPHDSCLTVSSQNVDELDVIHRTLRWDIVCGLVIANFLGPARTLRGLGDLES